MLLLENAVPGTVSLVPEYAVGVFSLTLIFAVLFNGGGKRRDDFSPFLEICTESILTLYVFMVFVKMRIFPCCVI